MKKQKFLSLFLCMLLIFSTLPCLVYAEDTADISVTLTIGKYGTLLPEVTLAPVQLTGKATYTLDDVLAAAHEQYYPLDDGYASEIGVYGTYITKFWGDESGNFGYQVNGGTEAVYNLDFVVTQGDYIDAFIYSPAYEAYAKFDLTEKEAIVGDVLELTLSQAGYENNTMVFSPCEAATITINGEMTDYITDTDGNVQLEFEDAGTYIISAKKTTRTEETELPDITAPVCMVTVSEPDSVTILHNIANTYSGENILFDGNMIWFLADLAVYHQLFPEKAEELSAEIKQNCIDAIVASALKNNTPSVLAKSIIALSALGYDAKNVYIKDIKQIDMVSELTAFIDEKAESVTNIYTLPYVIIALRQADSYATEEQMNYLLEEALQQKVAWQDNEWGTDAATAMLLALAPYYNHHEQITSVINETVSIIKSQQVESGAIGNAASTGLAIAALASLGEDVENIKNSDNNLIQGLMAQANEELTGFYPMENSFSTEQGFRGLLAWQSAKNDAGLLYDFSSVPKEAVYANWQPENCPVVFNITPSDAVLTIKDAEPIVINKYDLPEGSYDYTISANGYNTQTGSIEINATDAETHQEKEIIITLEKPKRVHHATGGGGSSVKVNITTNKEVENKTENTETKSEKETEAKPLFSEKTFADVKKNSWHYEAVKYVYENQLMEGTGNGFEPDKEMTRAMLVTVLYRLESPAKSSAPHRFADVNSSDWFADAVTWAFEKGLISGVEKELFAPNNTITREQLATILYRYAQFKEQNTSFSKNLKEYEDRKEISPWAQDALSWAESANLIQGTGDTTLSPKEAVTRAQLATVLMRFCEVNQ